MSKTIGRRVRERRETLGISQAALAERIGSTQKHISDIENDKVLMGAYMLLRLTKALHTSADALLGITEADTKGEDFAAGYAAAWIEAEQRVLRAFHVDPRIRR